MFEVLIIKIVDGCLRGEIHGHVKIANENNPKTIQNTNGSCSKFKSEFMHYERVQKIIKTWERSGFKVMKRLMGS